mgnify:CR=1 FL=1
MKHASTLVLLALQATAGMPLQDREQCTPAVHLLLLEQSTGSDRPAELMEGP